MVRIVIVGSGPAGLTLANELSRIGGAIQMIVLEAGGATAPAPEASDFVSIGKTEYKPIRHFMLGGHGHLWGGACPRLNPGDFRMKSDHGVYDDWPVSYEELVPYYERAEDMLSVGPRDMDALIRSTRLSPLLAHLLAAGRLGGVPYGKREFFVQDLAPSLLARQVDIRTNHIVRRIEKLGSGTVRLHCRNTTGDVTLDADIVVLATGGLSNARLLQLSKSDDFPDGLGNRTGNVGKYLMDHPRVIMTLRRKDIVGRAEMDPEGEFMEPPTASYRKSVSDGDPTVSFATVHCTNNISARFEAENTARYLASLSPENTPDFVNGLRDAIEFCNDMVLDFEVMEPPLPENRLVLADEKDFLGDPKLASDLNIDAERQRIFNSIIQDAKKNFTPFGYELTNISFNGWTGQHPSGTTRMSDNPQNGVVDRNLALFDADNIFVAGSSTFTTGGYANPTLTIVAMVMRLAEHIGARA